RNWTLTVNANPPTINPIANASTVCGTPYTSPAPTTSGGTGTITWTLLSGPAGMTINPSTGAVTWSNPLASSSAYVIRVQAGTACGNASRSWQLTVARGDFNGDGVRTASDIPTFVNDLLGISSTALCAADVNGDGIVDALDIQAFIAGL